MQGPEQGSYTNVPACRVCKQTFTSFADLKQHIRQENHHDPTTAQQFKKEDNAKPFGMKSQGFPNISAEGFQRSPSPFTNLNSAQNFQATPSFQSSNTSVPSSSTKFNPFSSSTAAEPSTSQLNVKTGFSAPSNNIFGETSTFNNNSALPSSSIKSKQVLFNFDDTTKATTSSSKSIKPSNVFGLSDNRTTNTSFHTQPQTDFNSTMNNMNSPPLPSTTTTITTAIDYNSNNNNNSNTISAANDSNYNCQLCNIQYENINQLQAHLTSMDHMNELKQQIMKQKAKLKSTSTTAVANTNNTSFTTTTMNNGPTTSTTSSGGFSNNTTTTTASGGTTTMMNPFLISKNNTSHMNTNNTTSSLTNPFQAPTTTTTTFTQSNNNINNNNNSRMNNNYNSNMIMNNYDNNKYSNNSTTDDSLLSMPYTPGLESHIKRPSKSSHHFTSSSLSPPPPAIGSHVKKLFDMQTPYTQQPLLQQTPLTPILEEGYNDEYEGMSSTTTGTTNTTTAAAIMSSKMVSFGSNSNNNDNNGTGTGMNTSNSFSTTTTATTNDISRMSYKNIDNTNTTTTTNSNSMTFGSTLPVFGGTVPVFGGMNSVMSKGYHKTNNTNITMSEINTSKQMSSSFTAISTTGMTILSGNNNNNNNNNIVATDDNIAIGTCIDMCPEEERIKRDQEIDLHQYEKLENNSSINSVTNEPMTLKDTMIKKFQRSSADHELRIPHLIRTPHTLYRTICYIETHIMDGLDEEPSSMMRYLFIWDRYRMIAKDFILQSSSLVKDAIWIECHERMARWYVLMDHRMKANVDYLGGHAQQNLESLNNLLKTLDGYYKNPLFVESPDAEYLLRNQGEFYSYFLLVQLGNTEVVTKFLQGIPSRALESDEMKFALKVAGVLKRGEYAQYFKLMVTEASPLQACLMHKYVGELRFTAFSKLVRSLIRQTYYPITHLMEQFLFECEEEVVEFLNTCGIDLAEGEPEEGLCAVLDNQNLIKSLPVDKNNHSLKPIPWYMGYSIDSRLSDMTTSETCHGFHASLDEQWMLTTGSTQKTIPFTTTTTTTAKATSMMKNSAFSSNAIMATKKSDSSTNLFNLKSTSNQIQSSSSSSGSLPTISFSSQPSRSTSITSTSFPFNASDPSQCTKSTLLPQPPPPLPMTTTITTGSLSFSTTPSPNANAPPFTPFQGFSTTPSMQESKPFSQSTTSTSATTSSSFFGFAPSTTSNTTTATTTTTSPTTSITHEFNMSTTSQQNKLDQKRKTIAIEDNNAYIDNIQSISSRKPPSSPNISKTKSPIASSSVIATTSATTTIGTNMTQVKDGIVTINSSMMPFSTSSATVSSSSGSGDFPLFGGMNQPSFDQPVVPASGTSTRDKRDRDDDSGIRRKKRTQSYDISETTSSSTSDITSTTTTTTTNADTSISSDQKGDKAKEEAERKELEEQKRIEYQKELEELRKKEIEEQKRKQLEEERIRQQKIKEQAEEKERREREAQEQLKKKQKLEAINEENKITSLNRTVTHLKIYAQKRVLYGLWMIWKLEYTKRKVAYEQKVRRIFFTRWINVMKKIMTRRNQFLSGLQSMLIVTKTASSSKMRKSQLISTVARQSTQQFIKRLQQAYSHRYDHIDISNPLYNPIKAVPIKYTLRDVRKLFNHNYDELMSTVSPATSTGTILLQKYTSYLRRCLGYPSNSKLSSHYGPLWKGDTVYKIGLITLCQDANIWNDDDDFLSNLIRASVIPPLSTTTITTTTSTHKEDKTSTLKSSDIQDDKNQIDGILYELGSWKQPVSADAEEYSNTKRKLTGTAYHHVHIVDLCQSNINSHQNKNKDKDSISDNFNTTYNHDKAKSNKNNKDKNDSLTSYLHQLHVAYIVLPMTLFGDITSINTSSDYTIYDLLDHMNNQPIKVLNSFHSTIEYIRLLLCNEKPMTLLFTHNDNFHPITSYDDKYNSENTLKVTWYPINLEKLCMNIDHSQDNAISSSSSNSNSSSSSILSEYEKMTIRILLLLKQLLHSDDVMYYIQDIYVLCLSCTSPISNNTEFTTTSSAITDTKTAHGDYKTPVHVTNANINMSLSNISTSTLNTMGIQTYECMQYILMHSIPESICNSHSSPILYSEDLLIWLESYIQYILTQQTTITPTLPASAKRTSYSASNIISIFESILSVVNSAIDICQSYITTTAAQISSSPLSSTSSSHMHSVDTQVGVSMSSYRIVYHPTTDYSILPENWYNYDKYIQANTILEKLKFPTIISTDMDANDSVDIIIQEYINEISKNSTCISLTISNMLSHYTYTQLIDYFIKVIHLLIHTRIAYIKDTMSRSYTLYFILSPSSMISSMYTTDDSIKMSTGHIHSTESLIKNEIPLLYDSNLNTAQSMIDDDMYVPLDTNHEDIMECNDHLENTPLAPIDTTCITDLVIATVKKTETTYTNMIEMMTEEKEKQANLELLLQEALADLYPVVPKSLLNPMTTEVYKGSNYDRNETNVNPICFSKENTIKLHNNINHSTELSPQNTNNNLLSMKTHEMSYHTNSYTYNKTDDIYDIKNKKLDSIYDLIQKCRQERLNFNIDPF